MNQASRDSVRKLIARVLDDRPALNLARLSRDMGKSHSYLQQFMERGVPRELKERDRIRLAELLGVDDTELGGPPKSLGAHTRDSNAVEISQFEGHLSAGSPAKIEEEQEVGRWSLPGNYIRHTLLLNPAKLALIPVRGDSMEPTLKSGDLVMVDLNDTLIAQPGIFALYEGDGTVVKRVEKIPGATPPRIRLMSDNPLHSTYDVPPEVVSIAGRVVWLGRRI